ncbi:hypothetical protein [Aestuariirhabdus haliotis]|nr:hypothetical protein [Aestuariirhabdus haliotis]
MTIISEELLDEELGIGTDELLLDETEEELLEKLEEDEPLE